MRAGVAWRSGVTDEAVVEDRFVEAPIAGIPEVVDVERRAVQGRWEAFCRKDGVAVVALGGRHLELAASLIDDPTATFADLVDADDRVAGAVFAYVLGIIVAGIVWITWQYRYAKNLTALGRPLEGGAGRAIWGWFIPLANYFIAPNQLLRAAKETDKARGGTGVAPPTLIPWWIAFGVGTRLSRK